MYKSVFDRKIAVVILNKCIVVSNLKVLVEVMCALNDCLLNTLKDQFLKC